MKKALAVLLAVVMAFSVCVVCVSAEDDGETAAGTTYYVKDKPGRITANTQDEVVILQGGDTLEFGTVTAKTSETKFKTIEVVYYPDAASIPSGNIQNTNWSEVVVPKYNLDAENWKLNEGQAAADLMAKSPNYFKSFYTTANFKKGDLASVTFVGLNDNEHRAHAKDSAGIDRGDLENGDPIDFALPGTNFLGWALYSYGTWRADKIDTLRVVVYALWERSAAEDKPDEPEKPDEPVDPQEPTEYATPIQATLAKWLAKIEEIFDYLKLAPAVPTMLGEVLGGAVRTWLYGLFGIEA